MEFFHSYEDGGDAGEERTAGSDDGVTISVSTSVPSAGCQTRMMIAFGDGSIDGGRFP